MEFKKKKRALLLKTIGFLGRAGPWAGRHLRGVRQRPAERVLANRTGSPRRRNWPPNHANTTINDEVWPVRLSSLAVKPQMMEALLTPLKFTLAERPGPVLSLCAMAAGLPISRIQELAGAGLPRHPHQRPTPLPSVGEG